MSYVQCPHCGTTLEHTPDVAGRVVYCPDCKGELQMPPLAPPMAQVAPHVSAPRHYHRQPPGPSAGTIIAIILACIGIGAPVVFVFVCCGGCINSVDRPGRDVATVQQAAKSGKLEVEIIKVRLEPFRTATGLDRYTVLVDWKNIGDRAVRGVRADIKAFDEDGHELYFAPNYYIYAGNNDGPGIAPGLTYSDPSDDGHIILTASIPARATVRVTKVEETGY